MLQRTKPHAGSSNLAYQQTGCGPDVVLIHGALTCLDDMVIALFPHLENEFRVTAFDRPGHGQTVTRVTGTPWRQAGSIHAAVTALGLEHPVIVGHSFGGAVALAYGLRYPEKTTGVVALSPIAFPEPRLEQALFSPRAIPGPIGFWGRSAGRLGDPLLLPLLWRAIFLPQAMPDRFAELFPFAEAGGEKQMFAEGQDAAFMALGVSWNAMAYAICKTPTHIVAGDLDAVVNTSVHAGALARQLPSAKLTRLPGLGHMIHHFAQPAIVEAIRELHLGVHDGWRRPAIFAEQPPPAYA